MSALDPFLALPPALLFLILLIRQGYLKVRVGVELG